jgi:uncharacterized protein YkwD
VPYRRKLILAAFLALAVPSAAQAQPKYTAERVAQAATAGAKASASCPNADLTPNAGNLDAIRVAIVCLHNQVRAQNGVPLLRGNTKLRRAAEGHSAEMVRAGYFDHTSLSGATMIDRVQASGYIRGARGWLLGENLEWGTGSLATPRGAVDSWLKSPGHRANLLKRGYRHLGVGVSLGTPSDSGRGMTVTVDFGARR